jgi:predicted ester cyclase
VGGDGDGDDPGVYEAYVERFRTALDGLSLRVESDVAADDRVAVVCTATGRHVGGLFGVEPSGEQVSIRLVQVARVAVDETGTAAVAEVWLSVDDAEIAWAVNDAETDDVRAPVPTTHSTPVVDDLAGTAEARSAGVSNAEGLWSGADVADRLVAENHVFRRAGTVVEGREAYVALVASYRAGFPDLQVTVRDVVAEGDRVVVRTTMTARHEGTFEGNEPTGRRVEAHWTFVHEVIDGRIVSTEVVGDHGWLLEQVSARPVSARATTDDPTGSTR